MRGYADPVHSYILILRHNLPRTALNHMPGTETPETVQFCAVAGRCDSVSKGAYLHSVFQVHQAPHKTFVY